MERLICRDNAGNADHPAWIPQEPVNDVPDPGMASVFSLAFGIMTWARRRDTFFPACVR
jgi:hypothetical protein